MSHKHWGGLCPPADSQNWGSQSFFGHELTHRASPEFYLVQKIHEHFPAGKQFSKHLQTIFLFVSFLGCATFHQRGLPLLSSYDTWGPRPRPAGCPGLQTSPISEASSLCHKTRSTWTGPMVKCPWRWDRFKVFL